MTTPRKRVLLGDFRDVEDVFLDSDKPLGETLAPLIAADATETEPDRPVITERDALHGHGGFVVGSGMGTMLEEGEPVRLSEHLRGGSE